MRVRRGGRRRPVLGHTSARGTRAPPRGTPSPRARGRRARPRRAASASAGADVRRRTRRPPRRRRARRARETARPSLRARGGAYRTDDADASVASARAWPAERAGATVSAGRHPRALRCLRDASCPTEADGCRRLVTAPRASVDVVVSIPDRSIDTVILDRRSGSTACDRNRRLGQARAVCPIDVLLNWLGGVCRLGNGDRASLCPPRGQRVGQERRDG